MTGGEKLQNYLRQISGKIANAGALPSVRVGFLESSGLEPGGMPTPVIAAIQEFGSRTIPPRPYFRGMIKAKGPAWGGDMGKILAGNGFDAAKTLGLMGMLIKGQLQDSITKLTSPALAPSTIRRKGFAKPLIDTGHMLSSVDYEVSA